MINHTTLPKKLYHQVKNLENCESNKFSSKGAYRANVCVSDLLRVVCRVGCDLAVYATRVSTVLCLVLARRRC